MDENTRALIDVTRRHTKTARNQLRTLARLYAELDEHLDELATTAKPKEAQRNARRNQE